MCVRLFLRAETPREEVMRRDRAAHGHHVYTVRYINHHRSETVRKLPIEKNVRNKQANNTKTRNLLPQLLDGKQINYEYHSSFIDSQSLLKCVTCGTTYLLFDLPFLPGGETDDDIEERVLCTK